MQSGKEEPFIALSVSTPLLLHMLKNGMDMVKHVNESLKEKAIPVLILPGLKRVENALYNCAANAMTELKGAVGSSARKTARERVRKIYLWWSDVCSPMISRVC